MACVSLSSDLCRANRRPHGCSHALLVLGGYTAFYLAFFAPVVLGSRLLCAATDAYIYHYPAVFGGRALWEPLLDGGHPRFADPQVMLWYPLALPLSLTGWEWLWNVFLLAPYVLASCFTYGLVWRCTRCGLAAAGAGLVFGLCGFLMAHMAHVAIVHAVAWLPLMLWSLDELSERVRPGWLAALAAAVACSFLAGHVQMFIYGLMLAGAYAAVLLYRAPAGACRYALAAALGVALGIGLAGVQLLPTRELLPYSARAGLTPAELSWGSLPPRQFPQLFFPYAYGGTDLAPERLFSLDPPERPGQAVAYFGAYNFQELTGFAGLLTLVLAGVGLAAGVRRRRTWFWAGTGAIGLILALGDATPLGRGLFEVPVLNKFRCPGRFLLWLDLGLAVLAGFGIHALQMLPRRRATWTLAVSSALALGGVAVAWAAVGRQLKDVKGTVPDAVRSAVPWENLGIGLPLLALALGLAAVWLGHGLRGRGAGSLVVLAVALDVGLFAWLAGWRLASPPRGRLRTVPADLAAVRDEITRTGERLVGSDPPLGCTEHRWDLDNPLHLECAPGNVCTLWGMGGTSYGPLRLGRTVTLLRSSWPYFQGKVDALLAFRYLLSPVRLRRAHGGVWEATALHGPLLGSAVPGNAEAVGYETTPLEATRLALISSLGSAAELADGAELVEVTVTTPSGPLPPLILRVGEHLAEWSWERPDVRPLVRHRLPDITEGHELRDQAGRPYRARHAVAFVSLGCRETVTGVRFRWVGPPGPRFRPLHLSLIDDATGAWHPVHPLRRAGDHWCYRATQADGCHLVLRNDRPLRRAWLVRRVVQLPAEAIAHTILREAALPDGSTFRPYETALVEAPVPFRGGGPEPDARAEIVSHEPQRVVVAVRAGGESFLVLGDTHYPGWQARVDGRRTPIYPTDYVLRGVVVPAGEHRVEFRFRPRSLRRGWVVSGLSGLLLLGVCLLGRDAARARQLAKRSLDSTCPRRRKPV